MGTFKLLQQNIKWQTLTLLSASALTTSGPSTTKTTLVSSTRKRPRSSSKTPSPRWLTLVSSPRLTLKLASRSSTKTALAPSRRTRWPSSSRRSLACEHLHHLAPMVAKAESSDQLRAFFTLDTRYKPLTNVAAAGERRHSESADCKSAQFQ